MAKRSENLPSDPGLTRLLVLINASFFFTSLACLIGLCVYGVSLPAENWQRLLPAVGACGAAMAASVTAQVRLLGLQSPKRIG